jgi:hypothetical protein
MPERSRKPESTIEVFTACVVYSEYSNTQADLKANDNELSPEFCIASRRFRVISLHIDRLQ